MLLAALGVSTCPFCMLVRSGLPPASYHRMPPGLPRFLLDYTGGATFDPGSYAACEGRQAHRETEYRPKVTFSTPHA